MNKANFRPTHRHCRKPRFGPSHLAAGFTLVELLVVTAVTAILASVAAPAMSAIVDSVRISSAFNLFVSGLYVARSEAIKLNSRVALCKSTDGAVCSMSGGWDQGWIIFHDVNNDAQRNGSEHIIQREGRLSPGLRLTGNLRVDKYISFTPMGTTRLVGGGFQAGTLTLCRHSADAGEARQIKLNAIGRPRADKTQVASCT